MTQALSPNARLIGQAGSRYRLDTPALLIDLDALERNIAAMAAHARAVSVALRPHAKTHKSVRIARMQVDAGRGPGQDADLGDRVQARVGNPQLRAARLF
jgi:D-serine deaminase-like pyridoxal phosphate-dependent protein